VMSSSSQARPHPHPDSYACIIPVPGLCAHGPHCGLSRGASCSPHHICILHTGMWSDPPRRAPCSIWDFWAWRGLLVASLPTGLMGQPQHNLRGPHALCLLASASARGAWSSWRRRCLG
jgi:hypothetical protein